MALARLMEAAPKRQVGNVPPPPPKPVLVEEPFEMEEPTIMSLEAIAAQVNRKPAPKASRKAEPAKRPEPKKAEPPRKASPDPAGFANTNGLEPRSKNAVPRTDGPVEAIEWKPAAATARVKADPAAAVGFLSPGSFLPLRTRFAALAQREAEPAARLDAVAFPLRGAELQVLRERLRRADRVGFGPA